MTESLTMPVTVPSVPVISVVAMQPRSSCGRK